MNETLYTCEYCHRVWDGNAQCPCWMDLCNSDNDSYDVKFKNVSTQTKSSRWGKTALERAQKVVDNNYLIIFGKGNTL
uniref:Uncharacterized protein n=1 Tax=viral metagenome TaxID=1070528 RepID=A0A6C0CWF3_9ZZZZ